MKKKWILDAGWGRGVMIERADKAAVITTRERKGKKKKRDRIKQMSSSDLPCRPRGLQSAALRTERQGEGKRKGSMPHKINCRHSGILVG